MATTRMTRANRSPAGQPDTTAEVISREEARRFLVSHLGLTRPAKRAAHPGIRETLGALRCIQLDPLDAIGQNADLVVLARVPGARRGDVHRAVYPGGAFEHFAKERCLLPASAFPFYRDRAVETPWWRHSERMKKLDAGLVRDVLDEVRARGPISARALEHRGSVVPIDWAGWKGTASAAKLALEVLWTRCEVVVAGRDGRDKLYDVPSRALPKFADAPAPADFPRWALVERVNAAGLLSRASGPWWSMLAEHRTGALAEELAGEGAIEVVAIEGVKRLYLAPRGFRAPRPEEPDETMRILGPLDPLLWDRALVRDVFGFDYVWEVYKPATERRWGWYVCPLLHRGRLVGRIEARIAEGVLVVDRLWREDGVELDEVALDAALEGHAVACGARGVKRGRGARRRGKRP